MPHVVVAGEIHPAGIAVLEGAEGVTFENVTDPDPNAYLARLPEADGVLLRTQPLTADAIGNAPRLRIVSRHGVGFDLVDVAALTARQIPLAIVGDVNSRTVAEHTMMLMLAASRRLVDTNRRLRQGDWAQRDEFAPREVDGKRLLIVGFGRIGRALAVRAAPFGLDIHVHDPFVDMSALEDVTPAPDLTAALGEADIVALHVPKTDTPILGAEEIAAMKPGSVIVNAARGGLIDEPALLNALEDGRVAAVGLDVFADEPPLPDDPLIAHPRVVATPHSAGLTLECAERMAVAATRNIVAHFAGRLDPALVVNRSVLAQPAGG